MATKAAPTKILIGTSGYNYKDWRGKFYPEKLAQKNWLQFYAENFSVLEVNATFYRFFPKKVFENWHDKTPRDFKFVIKGPRMITHMKKLVDVDESLENFLESIEGLGSKLAIILWQFPANFKNDPHNSGKLERFLKILPSNIPQAVELRHSSWFNQDTITLLEDYKISFIINDTPTFDTAEIITGPLVYIRFHGPQGLYASSYSDKQLKTWSEKIKNFSKTKDVFCFFNNDVSGYAIENAKKLEAFVNRLPRYARNDNYLVEASS